VAFEPGRACWPAPSDWAIDITMARGADDFEATVAHGSPYAWFRVGRGDLRVRLPAAGERLHAAGRPAHAGAARRGKTYALFGPTGVQWESASPTEWIARLPAGKGYLSVAGLPDDRPPRRPCCSHAYAFVRRHAGGLEGRRGHQPGGDHLHRHHAGAGRARPRRCWACTRTTGSWQCQVEGRWARPTTPCAASCACWRLEQLQDHHARYTGFVPYWPASPRSPRMGELRDVMNRRHPQRAPRCCWRRRGRLLAGQGPAAPAEDADVYEQQGDKAAATAAGPGEDAPRSGSPATDRRALLPLDQAMGVVSDLPGGVLRGGRR
jgi:hypothetical protein